MIIALAAILTLLVVSAVVLAFAGGSNSRTDAAVATALSSTEPVRMNQAAWDEFDAARATWTKDDVAA